MEHIGAEFGDEDVIRDVVTVVEVDVGTHTVPRVFASEDRHHHIIATLNEGVYRVEEHLEFLQQQGTEE